MSKSKRNRHWVLIPFWKTFYTIQITLKRIQILYPFFSLHCRYLTVPHSWVYMYYLSLPLPLTTFNNQRSGSVLTPTHPRFINISTFTHHRFVLCVSLAGRWPLTPAMVNASLCHAQGKALWIVSFCFAVFFFWVWRYNLVAKALKTCLKKWDPVITGRFLYRFFYFSYHK